MDIMASNILTYSWQTFTDILLFTECVFICINTLNKEVCHPER